MAFTCLHRIALNFFASFHSFHTKKTLRQILGKIDHRGIFNSLYNYLDFYSDIYFPKFREDTRLSKNRQGGFAACIA